jgi:crossover junction endodeoxyribonuclease RusA
MNSITISIPFPPRELRPNARVHWAVKARATKHYRTQAWAAALASCNNSPPRWLKASVKVNAFFPTRKQPDPDNLIASLKAAFDGIGDAGIVINDRGLWPLRPEFFTDKANPRIELTITGE